MKNAGILSPILDKKWNDGRMRDSFYWVVNNWGSPIPKGCEECRDSLSDFKGSVLARPWEEGRDKKGVIVVVVGGLWCWKSVGNFCSVF